MTLMETDFAHAESTEARRAPAAPPRNGSNANANPDNEAGANAGVGDARALPELTAKAVVFEGDRQLRLAELELSAPGASDLVIDTEFSGVSTGTERLFWTGEMPPFPGMSYPLVPGYETVGRVVWAEERADLIGKRVFAPGSKNFKEASGLFGGAASRIIAPAARVTPVAFDTPEEAALLALAATAYHAVDGGEAPDLVIGHGVLGRLVARIVIALGAPPPVVWEIDPERADSAQYAVIDPECDGRADYRSICDVSGDANILDALVRHMAPGGEIALAGFYDRLSFAFAPAFMKEARIRVAAEWKEKDIVGVKRLVDEGKLSLDGLITHRASPDGADGAYRTAFEDPACLKMILDWRNCA